MLAVAEAGYRAIAPDIRGYGQSDQPRELETASWEDLILDLLAILDSLRVPKVSTSAYTSYMSSLCAFFYLCMSHTNINLCMSHTNINDQAKAFMVGKDFGAIPAYDFALHHPDRVSGVVTLGIPFSPKGIDFDLLPKGFYISRWRVNPVMKHILHTSFSWI